MAQSRFFSGAGICRTRSSVGWANGMLHSLFSLLDTHPDIYWSLAWLAMALLLAWALAPQFPATAARLRSPAFGGLTIALALLAWRWPWLLAATEFNPDESQIIAGAMALARDPVFWRSVDGTTSGPLNYYPLLPIVWLGLPLDFFTGRLAGLFMAGGGCFALYRALARSTDEGVARLGVLPPVLFFATTIDPDFFHYSSEHVTLLLGPVALWLIVRYRTHAAGGLWNLRFAAVAAGAIPWAKLQGVPIAGVLLLWIAWLAWTSARETGARIVALAGVTLAGLATSLVFAGMTASAGVFGVMLHRYVLQNAAYVDATAHMPPSLPGLLRRAAEFGQFTALGLTAVVLAIGAGVALVRQRRWPGELFGVALVWLGAATFAIAVPRREFLHYLLLAVTPLALLAAIALAQCWQCAGRRARKAVVAAFVVFGFAAPLAWRAQHGVPFMIGGLLDQWRRPAHGDGAILRTLGRPGDTLAIWGWSARTYIEAGMPQATRDTHTFWATGEQPGHDPIRQVFLADFRAELPPFFVDATGEGAFFYSDRERHGHENFPALAEEIRRHYTALIDLGYSRVYIRNDRLADQPLTPAEASALAARARQIELPPGVPYEMTFVDGAHFETVEGRRVVVMPAPSRAYCILDPSTRALDLAVRFHPRALAEGTSDGADIAIELVDPRGERRIFQQRIESKSGELLQQRIVLPPFAYGTHVQIRALPGPTLNNAWDWLCIENLRPVRRSLYIAEQFPHFNRLPLAAEFATAELIGTDAATAIRATAPGRFEFPLTPTDRRFTLTLKATSAGEADLVVEQVGADGARAVLARSDLASLPQRNGAAVVQLALPASTAGDRLCVTVRAIAAAPVVDFMCATIH